MLNGLETLVAPSDWISWEQAEAPGDRSLCVTRAGTWDEQVVNNQNIFIVRCILNRESKQGSDASSRAVSQTLAVYLSFSHITWTHCESHDSQGE
jgi:hypothetical protein